MNRACVLKELRLRLWPCPRPQGGIEQVRPAVAARCWQHVIEAWERVEYLAGEGLRGAVVDEPGDLAHHRIRPPQRLYGRKGAEVGTTQQHEPPDLLRARQRERRTAHQPAHAVGHDGQPVRGRSAQPLGKSATELVNAEPPVVRVEDCRESGGAQFFSD